MKKENDQTLNFPIAFLLESVDDILIAYNLDNMLLAASDSFYRFFGIPKQDETPRRFLPVLEDNAWVDATEIKHLLFSKPYHKQVTVEMLTKSGMKIVTWHRHPVFDEHGAFLYLTAVGKPHEESHENLKNLIYYDDLTGLFKRTYLFEKVEKKYLVKGIKAAGIAIGFRQLDEMELLFGEKTVNRLRVSAAREVEGQIPEGCVLVRCAESQMFVFYPNFVDKEAVHKLAESIVDALDVMFSRMMADVQVKANAGIAYYPDDVISMSELLYYSNVALRHAGDLNKRGFCEYNTQYKEEVIDNYALMKDLERAIEKDEFVLHYQPIINPETMEVDAVEALLRWDHPQYGMISPLKFIRLAEASGTMVRVGNLVMEKVNKQMTEWSEMGLNRHGVSINVASCQLTQRRFDKTVAKIFGNIDLSRLRFELSDAASLGESDVVRQNIERLRNLGIKIAIGDLGLEYSTLSMLDRFEFDVIKIDDFFVEQNKEGKISQMVLDMLKRMMAAMNTIYIKEGIETKEQLAAMKELGFTLMQGYYFSKPVDSGQITKMIKKGVNAVK